MLVYVGSPVGVSVGSSALDAAVLELLEALEMLQQKRQLLTQLLRQVGTGHPSLGTRLGTCHPPWGHVWGRVTPLGDTLGDMPPAKETQHGDITCHGDTTMAACPPLPVPRGGCPCPHVPP